MHTVASLCNKVFTVCEQQGPQIQLLCVPVGAGVALLLLHRTGQPRLRRAAGRHTWVVLQLPDLLCHGGIVFNRVDQGTLRWQWRSGRGMRCSEQAVQVNRPRAAANGKPAQVIAGLLRSLQVSCPLPSAVRPQLALAARWVKPAGSEHA